MPIASCVDRNVRYADLPVPTSSPRPSRRCRSTRPPSSPACGSTRRRFSCARPNRPRPPTSSACTSASAGAPTLARGYRRASPRPTRRSASATCTASLRPTSIASARRHATWTSCSSGSRPRWCVQVPHASLTAAARQRRSAPHTARSAPVALVLRRSVDASPHRQGRGAWTSAARPGDPRRPTSACEPDRPLSVVVAYCTLAETCTSLSPAPL